MLKTKIHTLIVMALSVIKPVQPMKSSRMTNFLWFVYIHSTRDHQNYKEFFYRKSIVLDLSGPMKFSTYYIPLTVL